MCNKKLRVGQDAICIGVPSFLNQIIKTRYYETISNYKLTKLV